MPLHKPPVRITRMGMVNGYIVCEDDGLTVIDTMLPGSHKAILAAAQELGLPIRRIALTHAHGDHIGGLDRLAGAVPDADVLISSRDARLLKKDKSLDAGEPQRKPPGSFPGAKTEPTRTLQAGDTVGSLEVHAAPGHTPGHIAFFDPRDRTLFCGDVYSTLGGVATSARVNPRFPLPAFATWDKPTELRSAQALLTLEPARLAPGHGAIVVAPMIAMADAIAKAS